MSDYALTVPKPMTVGEFAQWCKDNQIPDNAPMITYGFHGYYPVQPEAFQLKVYTGGAGLDYKHGITKDTTIVVEV